MPFDPAALERIAAALERLAPEPAPPPDWGAAAGFVWRSRRALPVTPAPAATLTLLRGMDEQKARLLANTRRLAARAPAANALLWGARGTGKSALVRAVHAAVRAEGAPLALIEVAADALAELPCLLAALASAPVPALVWVVDLSLAADDAALRGLKLALDGGLAGRPPGIAVYATSNRRHLVTRDPRENAADDLFWSDTAEERLALSDRFGLHLGFHPMDQDVFLEIVAGYADALELAAPRPALLDAALLFARTRGQRSGRTARQFIEEHAAAEGKAIPF